MIEDSIIIREDIHLIASTDLPWEEMHNRTILISGGSGFLASYLVKALLLISQQNQLNIKIICVVRNIKNAKLRLANYMYHSGLLIIEHDISKSFPSDFHRADYIIHCASQASPKYYGVDPIGTLLANSIGTKQLLDYALKSRSEKFLFFSSGEVYGIPINTEQPIGEMDFGHLDPMNVQSTVVSIESLKPIPDIHVQNLTATNSTVFDYSVGIEKTISLINKAKRPVLWLGNGIRAANASDLVIPLVDQLAIPTLVSWQACDILDSNHPLCFGRAGVYGQRAANFVLQNCDTLICIGTRLAIPQIGYDLSEFARDAQIVMVDIDEKELLKLGEKINVPILSDAGQFIKQLINHHQTKLNIQGWISQCNLYKHNYPVVGKEHDDITDASGTTYMNSYRFMQKLEKHFHPDQIVTTDMGTALLSGHQVLKFKNGQRMLTSTGLGEMGFGLPAAIGAAIATNREVLCLNCDGGMMLNLQELQTVVHHRLPIKIIIFNNDGYLMIKHTQKALFNGRYAGSDKKSGVTCPNFSKLAVAFDIPTYQIRSWENFDYIIGVVQAERGPVICEVFTHPEQPFTPKLSVVSQSDGSLVSPPLEDLSPLLTREEMKENMIIGLHPKSLNF